MSKILQWANEYQDMLNGARERSKERFEAGIEEVPPYMNSANIQSWLEELAIAIIEENTPDETH